MLIKKTLPLLLAVFLCRTACGESIQKELLWDGKSIINLSGNWNFFSNVLLESSENRPVGITSYSFPFKGSWHEHTAGKNQLPVYGCGTYQKTVKLSPEKGKHVVLRLPPIDIAVRVYCNGIELYTNGKVSQVAEETIVRDYKPVLRELTSENGVYDICIQTANFDLPRFGLYNIPIIVSMEKAFQMQILATSADAFTATAMLIFALFHIMAGLKIKHNKWCFHLGFSYIAAMFFLLANGEVLLCQIGLPRLYDWKIHYLARFLSSFFFIRYILDFFIIRTPEKILKIINAAAALFSVFFIASGPSILPRFYLFSALFSAGTVLFALAASIRALIIRSGYAVPFFVSSLILTFFMALDTIYNPSGWPILYNCKSIIGLLLFGLIHSFILMDMLGKHVDTIENLVDERTKELEISLWSQARHASMGELMNFIAHQWQQYLYAISIYIEGLQSKKEMPFKKRKEVYGTISEAVQSMFSTLKDFRSFLTPIKETERFSVFEECEKVCALLQDFFLPREIEVSITAQGDTSIRGIKNELEQVILNILTNAANIFERRMIEIRSIYIKAEGQDTKVIVSIEDNAGGISKAIRPHIFERYNKFGNSGSGMGLYMSKRIIRERFGGDLFYKDGESGTIFVIELPRDCNCPIPHL